jgi:hypothetical protein
MRCDILLPWTEECRANCMPLFIFNAQTLLTQYSHLEDTRIKSSFGKKMKKYVRLAEHCPTAHE